MAKISASDEVARLFDYETTSSGSVEEKNAFYENTKHFLLISSIVSGAFALNPTTRLAGLGTYRSITFCVTIFNTLKGWNEDDNAMRAIKIGKICLSVLRISASVMRSPGLIIASISSEIGLNAIEFGKCLYDGNYSKIVKPITVIFTSSLMLTGMILGTAEIMLVAAVLNSISLTIFAFVNANYKQDSALFEKVSFLVLGGISLAITLVIRPYENQLKIYSNS